MTIRVLIADDQVMIRDGLAALLSSDPGIEVIGQAGNGREAVEMARRLDPDVVVMDIRMPEMDGLAATAELAGDLDPDADPAAARPKVLVLTTFDLDEYVYEALGAGASGFLLKDASAADLVTGVRVVAAGDALLAPSITRRLIGDFARRRRHQRPSPKATAGLTPRELDVLRLIARGLSNAEIAAELVLAEQTVKTHVGHVLTKLMLRDRTQAVVYAYENGLVG
ncbi:response regulator transcription factor [Actinomadura madurae]|uniref:DNA-binding response regulator, NarL/FixJ family, contains REC and HTH domains n=2 Tax=Thermomonosporaceae TaxID=2012 RepID=A0A1I5WBQ1_9ACTN|nr:response regulator transcription factor [Actinomadura madurae]SFQ17057.1 DNA-binding response regulator, NarL/FixJ family, contains REC and HTH domains [Actinomadura madurae]